MLNNSCMRGEVIWTGNLLLGSIFILKKSRHNPKRSMEQGKKAGKRVGQRVKKAGREG